MLGKVFFYGRCFSVDNFCTFTPIIIKQKNMVNNTLRVLICSASAIVFFSEMLISYQKRAGKHTQKADQGSLRLIWRVISVSSFVGFFIGFASPYGGYEWGQYWLNYIALGLVPIGMIVRQTAINTLKEFFTVQVAISPEHKLIDTGLYHYIRHPSYTGIIIYMVGLSVSLSNWISILLLLIPVFGVIMYRIGIEEAALINAFGKQYEDYRKRTGKLLPKFW